MSDPGDETPDWPDQLGEMERDVTGCPDNCCRPDHGHLVQVFAESVGTVTYRMKVKLPEQWRETLEKAREFNALPDTHAEWRSLNESEDAA